jgi:hypothetical protein
MWRTDRLDRSYHTWEKKKRNVAERLLVLRTNTAMLLSSERYQMDEDGDERGGRVWKATVYWCFPAWRRPWRGSPLLGGAACVNGVCRSRPEQLLFPAGVSEVPAKLRRPRLRVLVVLRKGKKIRRMRSSNLRILDREGRGEESWNLVFEFATAELRRDRFELSGGLEFVLFRKTERGCCGGLYRGVFVK